MIPRNAREERVPLRGGSVRVLRSLTGPSDRPPIVLIHGGGVDNSVISWHFAFDDLAKYRQVVAFDLPGFGLTADIEPVGGPAEMADFTAELLEALGIRVAVIGGVSMGGDVALNVGLRHPELVEALILVAPGGLTPIIRGRVTQFSSWLAAKLPDSVLFGLSRLMMTQGERMLRAAVHESNELPRALVDEFMREQRRPDANLGYVRYNQTNLGPAGMKNDLRPLVSEIAQPAMFFHGADDPMVSPEDSQVAAALMPNARIHLVPHCGHWAQLEKPEAFAEAVKRFLAELCGGSAAATD